MHGHPAFLFARHGLSNSGLFKCDVRSKLQSRGCPLLGTSMLESVSVQGFQTGRQNFNVVFAVVLLGD